MTPQVAPMSLGEAARRFGFSGPQRMRRYLRAIERRLGKAILIPLGGGIRPRLVVTIPVLRDACPELFSRRDEAVAALREYVSDLDERIAELHQRDNTIAQEIGKIRRDIERITPSRKAG